MTHTSVTQLCKIDFLKIRSAIFKLKILITLIFWIKCFEPDKFHYQIPSFILLVHYGFAMNPEALLLLLFSLPVMSDSLAEELNGIIN